MKANLLIILLISTISAFGQNSSLAGKIILTGTKQAIADVYVYFDEIKKFDITNGKGEFYISDIPPGKYTLRTSIIGYKDLEKKINFDDYEDREIILEIVEEFIDLPLINIAAYSGTGGAAGSLDLAGSAHYISKKHLELLNSSNIHEILNEIPGVQVQEEDGFGLRPNIGLRGTGSERSSKITIMEDGILSAPAPYSAPSAYYFPSINRMDAIEILKGASQIKYGPYTTGGVINMISAPLPEDFSGSINASFGNFGIRQLHARLGDQINQFSYLIEGLQNQSTGFKHIQNRDENTGFIKHDGLIKLQWSSREKANFLQRIQLKYSETNEESNETYLGLSKEDFYNDPYVRYSASKNDKMKARQRHISLNHLISPFENTFIQTSVYQNQFSRNWYKLDYISNQNNEKVNIAQILNDPDLYQNELTLLQGRNALENEYLSLKANNRDYISRGIQSKFTYDHRFTTLEAGIRAHYDEMDRFQWNDQYIMDDTSLELINSGQPGTESNRIESALAFSTYLKGKMDLKHFVIEFGLRNENISMKRSDYGKRDPERTGEDLNERENNLNIWIPGVSVQYLLSETQQIFGGIHRGFSPPGSKPGTKAEMSVNYELGYKYGKEAFFASLVLFRNDYANLLGSDFASSGGTGSADQFNGGQSVVQGIEAGLNAKFQISKKLYIPLDINLNYLDARFLSNFNSDFEPWGSVEIDDQLPYLSREMFNLRSGINHGKVLFNLSANYSGAMRTEAAQGSISSENEIPGRWVCNASVVYKIKKTASIQTSVFNIFNNQYIVAQRPAGWRPGAPRIVKFSLNAHF